MSRILLTGATGFVGGRVAEQLRDRDDEVVALVRTVSDALDRQGVEQIVGALDAAELPSTVQGVGFDGVIHAAASMHDDLEVARRVNRDGTRLLADLALRQDARFVYVSTTSVYDLPAIGDAEVHEDAPSLAAGADTPAISSSASAYGVSKAEGDLEVARARDAGLAATVLRPPAVLGTGPTSTWGTRVPARLREGTWSPPHPATTLGWVHVEDLVAAILAAVDRPASEAVNVVGGQTTFGAYLEGLAQQVPGIAPDAAVVDDEGRLWRGSYATGRLGQLLGVTPRWSFEDAMAEIGRWWAETDAESQRDR